MVDLTKPAKIAAGVAGGATVIYGAYRAVRWAFGEKTTTKSRSKKRSRNKKKTTTH